MITRALISVTDKTGKLTLKLPMMTSNMDTITESAMAKPKRAANPA